MVDDLALLRKFEPVLHFTQGEMFFPMAIDGYLKRSSAWIRDPTGSPIPLAKVGDLTAESLGRLSDLPGTPYLQFVQEPMDLAAYLRWRRDPQRPAFEAVGRWARVGLASRLLDAAYDAATALRGQVPGGTTAVAEQQYRQAVTEDPRPIYYGRVIRDADYTVLQYLFFYAMNDFRSSFYGVNDHEADWEQVLVYVAEDPEFPQDLDRVTPGWVALAAHDLNGPDLRYRWDDPALGFVDKSHPVVYVAAGSHAAYVESGEYLFGVQPRFLVPVYRLVQSVRRHWRETLRQGPGEGFAPESPLQLSIPFVDYARGDGQQIGHSERPWSPVVVSGSEPWLSTYRGLWGLDTRDPLGGERAPAGPKYDRHGNIRQSWFDPVGFCGLDTEVPAPLLRSAQRVRLAELHRIEAELALEIDVCRKSLRAQELDRSALAALTGPAPGHQDPDQEQREQLRRLLRERSEAGDAIAALETGLSCPDSGLPGDPRAHLKHNRTPLPVLKRLPRGGELWAATSGGLLLLLLGVLPTFGSGSALISLAVGLVVVFGIDAVVRGRGVRYVLGYTIFLAVISTATLAVKFWKFAIITGVALVVMSTVRDNVRELRLLRHRTIAARQDREESRGPDSHN